MSPPVKSPMTIITKLFYQNSSFSVALVNEEIDTPLDCSLYRSSPYSYSYRSAPRLD